ncbi:MAG: hypothetical protein JJ869_10775 [Marivita sp.]|uniref:hypothetical protein n=1 Tax=Marivita sp. TaxID=2003365 RepID=UPI001B0FA654|nr:hypothetical protein [Marivita sp.]MBO6884049.1 hypothetical protein [Marivita sp.]
MSFFEPSPILLAFIFVQRFVFFEVLGLIALLRLIVGRGIARVPALLTLLISLAAIFATFAPVLNLQSLPLYADIARLMASGGGMVLPLVASAVFATSLVLPQRHWRWIDPVHVVGMLAFLGLWVATRV